MPYEPQWQGSSDELQQLLVAMTHNCTCTRNDAGAVTAPCSLHREPMSQAALDKILFMRRIAERLTRGEFLEDAV